MTAPADGKSRPRLFFRGPNEEKPKLKTRSCLRCSRTFVTPPEFYTCPLCRPAIGAMRAALRGHD